MDRIATFLRDEGQERIAALVVKATVSTLATLVGIAVVLITLVK